MTSLSDPDLLTAAERLRLSPTQSDMWMEQARYSTSDMLLISTRHLMPVALDVDRFRQATDEVLRTNEAFFMRLHASDEGVPLASFNPDNAPTCQFVDLSHFSDPQDELTRQMDAVATTPFTMLDAPLVRIVLYKLDARLYCFLCTAHHIVADGWAMGITLPRIADRYRSLAEDPHSPPLALDRAMSTYLRAGADKPDDAYVARATAFWQKLQSELPVPIKPAHPAQDARSEYRCGRIEFAIDRSAANHLAHLVEGVTLYHILLFAWAHLLRRTYSLERCTMSMPILNRGKEHKDTIGLFMAVRALPIPHDENASIADNLHSIARRIRDLFRHYKLPNSEIGRLAASNGLSPQESLLSSSSLSYITRDYGAEIEGHQTQMHCVWSKDQLLPFTLYAMDIYPERDITMYLLHHLRAANHEEAALFPARFHFILEQLANGLDRPLRELDIIPPEERARIRAALDNTHARRSASQPVLHDILARARQCPQACAIEEADGRQLTYAGLVDRAHAMAHALHQRGVRPGHHVVLLLPRGADLFASILGTWLCGAAYVPVDPSTPDRRLLAIAENCAAPCLITTPALRGKTRTLSTPVLLADEVPPAPSEFTSLATLAGPAYIIYTSGSTGQPKGVMIGQAALAEHLANWLTVVSLEKGDGRSCLFASPAFDASVDSTFPNLVLGNAVVCAPHPQWPAHEFPRVVVERRLTQLELPPAYAMEVLHHARQHPGAFNGHQLRLCFVGGDVLPGEAAALWESALGKSARFYNTYGPTETTVTVTLCEATPALPLDPGESIPIGAPHPGQWLRIVDAAGRDVPIGAEGELHIGGVGLATGYHGMPEETANRFPTHPECGRYYRTGDLVRLRTDGQIGFLRRVDSQIKVRGFRIELGEIEGTLAAFPHVLENAVVAPADAHGERTLHAFVAPLPNRVVEQRALREHLAKTLPAYMIPQVHVLASLPKNISGKIDRQALAKLAQAVPSTPDESGSVAARAPAGPVQEYLAGLWEQTLGHKISDVTADFFEQGGHSLLAARLVAAMGKAFRVDYPFADFFGAPTIEGCQRHLETLVGGTARLEQMARLRLELSQLSPEEVKARLERLRK